MKLPRIGIAVVLVIATMVGQLFSGAVAQAADNCTLSPMLVNSCRPLLGGYTTGYPNIANGALGQAQAAESRIGRQYDIVHTAYHTGPSQLTSEEITLANRPNTNVFLNWKPDTGTNAWLNADGAANGGLASTDAGIVEMADSVKSVPSQVMITIWHEPENDVTPGTVTSTTPNPGTNTPACPAGVTLKGTAGSPAQYVAMWQNVENIFAQQGVTNVVWVMTNETYAPFNCLTNLLYPGNSLVNWMAFDTYNSTNLTGAEGTPQAPFEATAGVWYNHLTQLSNPTENYLSKPWMVGEFGTCLASHSQTQIDDYFADAKYSVDNNLYPNVKAYVAFDAPGSGNTAPGGCMIGYTPSGTLDPATQADYNSFADDPLFTDAAYTPAPDTAPPSVPTGLVAAPASGSQINVSWSASTDNIGVAGYQVFRNGTQVATVTNGTTYSDTGLTGATSYQYTVDAFDAAGNISAQTSAVAAATPDVAAPSVPANVVVTAAPNGTEIDLTWSASTDDVGVAGYDVYRNGMQVGNTTSGTSYADTGLTTATSYQYTVAAYDAAGNVSAQSAVAAAITPDTAAPNVPTGLSATPNGGGQITLNWTAATDNVGVAGYNVYRGGALVATVTSGTSYVDTGLTDGTLYSYTVAAYDAAGNIGAQSAAVSAMTSDVSPPSAPTNVIAMATSGNQVNVNWSASTDNVGVTGYQVLRNGVVVAFVTSGTSYSDSGLTDATSYTYTVVAYDAAGNASATSASASVNTPDVTPPSVPANVAATVVSGTQVNVSWTAATDNVGVAGYNVYRGGTLVATVTSGTVYADSGLASGGTYQYTVAAYDAAGNVSSQSAAANVTTPDTVAPSVPANVTATAASGSQVNVSWSASTDNVGVAGYRVYRNGAVIASVTTGTTYADTGLTNATNYQYAVAAYDAAGNASAQTAPVTVATPDMTSPSAPAALTATAVSGSQINLSWTAATDNVGVAGYRILRNGSVIGSVTSGTTYSDTGLISATTYQYAVVAYDVAGNVSAQSGSASAKTPDTIAPSVPTNLATTSTASNLVTVSWTAASDNVGVVGYHVYRGGSLIATVTSGTSYQDKTVLAKVKYSYTVDAYDAAGNKSAQTAASSVTPPDTIAPAVPTNLKLTTSGTSVSLSWTAATDNIGVTGYTIYRNGAKLATTTSLKYTDTTGVQGSTYKYTVSAFDAAGNNSAQSAAQTTSIADTVAPTKPTNLKLTAASKSLTLTWTAATDNVGVTGYSIYRGGVLVATVSGTATSFTNTGLTTGTSYSYDIVAFDAAGNKSPASATVSLKAK